MLASADSEWTGRRGYGIFRTRELYPGEKAPHQHDFYELCLIWSGSMYYRVDGQVYHLTNGDILMVAPGEYHQAEPEQEQPACERLVLRMEKGNLHLFRAFGFDPTSCFGGEPAGRIRCLRFDDEVTVRIGELLDRCLRESASEEFGAGMMADTYMVQSMILVNRLYRRNIRGQRRDRSGTLVNSVIEYINNHYTEELSLDSLAGRFFISKYHLSREFGRITGISVHRYITQKRLVVAKQMLSEGRPSSAGYQHCGFGDYSNFYRAFRGEYGISPKAYVATLREAGG